MDIKKENVKLLLGKVKVYLDTQPQEKKKGKRFAEAEKALARMQKLLVGRDEEIGKKACRKGHPVMPGGKAIGVRACQKGRPVMPGSKTIGVRACQKGRPVMPVS